MSQRIPGYNQDQMRALWRDFVQKTLGKTRFKTTFGGMTRNVYRDGSSYLVVLDEWHGDLELLAFQDKAGPGTHVGSQEIDIVATSPTPQFKRGRIAVGGKHKFVLIGSL
jgi:hypothetical protein